MALDAAKGEMLVAFLLPPHDAAAAADAAASIWRAAYADGVRPGAAVGIGLFPCLSGYGGAKVRVNLGLDAARPLRLAAPTSEFRPAREAWVASPAAKVPAAARARAVSRMCLSGAWDVWVVTRICVWWSWWWKGVQGDDSADTAGLLKRLVEPPPPPPLPRPTHIRVTSHLSHFTLESVRTRVTAALAQRRENRLPNALTETRLGVELAGAGCGGGAAAGGV